MFLRIESEQEGECFDCEEWAKIYGVQKVLRFSGGQLFQFDDKTVMRLPPLPDDWNWQPTCRECGIEHEMMEQEDEEADD